MTIGNFNIEKDEVFIIVELNVNHSEDINVANKLVKMQ